jgi:hypothetical protein
MDLEALLTDKHAPQPTAPRPVDPTAVRLTQLDALRSEMEENFHLYSEVQRLTPSDRDALFALLLDAQQENPSGIKALHALLYDEIPVPMDEFLLGRKYLNLKGRINPEKVDVLTAFDQPHVRTGWLAIGSGGGKGFSVSCAMARMAYRLLCLRRPDLYYLLGPGSKISLINLSVSKEQAKAVVFDELLARVSNCAWFANKYRATGRSMLFPAKGIAAFSGGSSATSYYGYHTIMGTIDEAAFMIEGGRDLAEELIEALRKSMNTRFPGNYKLMVISTLRAAHDFVNVNIERIKAEGVQVR